MSEYWKEAKQGADADAVSRRDGPGEAGEPERGSGSDVPWEGVPEGADAGEADRTPLDESLEYPDSAPPESGVWTEDALEEKAAHIRNLAGPRKRRGRNLVKPGDPKRNVFTPEQRLLILDTWKRSGLPAKDFAALCGFSPHSLYTWKKRFETQGPAGLMDAPKGGPRGSRLPDITKRTILMLKEAHPEYGCERISYELMRGPALGASPSAVAKVLHEAGYVLEEKVTRPHPPPCGGSIDAKERGIAGNAGLPRIAA